MTTLGYFQSFDSMGFLSWSNLEKAVFIQHYKCCHLYNWEPFERYAVKSFCSAMLKLFYRWQKEEVATILVIIVEQSYCSNYTKSLIILKEAMQSWLKINFRDIRKNQKASSVPTRPRACAREEKRADFFSRHCFSFPFLNAISQQHQRACCLSEPDLHPVQ